MNIFFKKQRAIIAIALFSGTATPISDTTKNTFAIGGGITSAALVAYLASNSTDNSAFIALCATVAGGTTWWLLDYILTQFTPAAQLEKAAQLINDVAACADELSGFNGKTHKLNMAETIITNIISKNTDNASARAILQQAHALMREIKTLRYTIKIKLYERNLIDCRTFLFNLENNILISRDLANEEELLAAVNLFSNTTWPLLKAKEFLFNKTTDLESFQKTLDDLISDLLDDTKQTVIVAKANNFITQILTLKSKLQQKMSQVLSHKKYAQELASYEHFQEAERQREFLLEKAREEARLKEQELREQARLKERELQIQQNFQYWQNNKDRKLKESLANKPSNTPAQVVIHV